jgi:hypothetical protein
MHVDDDQAVAIFGKYVNTGQLCYREAKRRHLARLRLGLHGHGCVAQRGVAR